MSFTFNFDLLEDECDDSILQSVVTSCRSISTNTSGTYCDVQKDDASTRSCVTHASPLPAVEIKEFYCDRIINKLEMKAMIFGEMCLKVVDTSTMEQKLLDDLEISCILKSSEQLKDAVNSQSDLVAGVYEGGLKIWECGIDLAEFLSSHSDGVALDLKGKRVLELGCGAGLPGLYCYKCGASQVDFQDYNEEVLKLITHTNVLNNQVFAAPVSGCRYFAGDWSSFSGLAVEESLKYDIILTAETIYNTDNYSKLHDVFKAALTDSGIIYIAAKTYYFGVGGSVDSFIEYVRRESCFSVHIVHSFNKGIQRKILKLQRLLDDPSAK